MKQKEWEENAPLERRENKRRSCGMRRGILCSSSSSSSCSDSLPVSMENKLDIGVCRGPFAKLLCVHSLKNIARLTQHAFFYSEFSLDLLMSLVKDIRTLILWIWIRDVCFSFLCITVLCIYFAWCQSLAQLIDRTSVNRIYSNAS